jgi:peptidoglycan hydrolase-like protein with peptidoglycan-binding domain
MILSLGSHGDEVRQLEQRLKDLNLYTGSIDGVFGGGVQSAVQAFQGANGLAADGVVGPQTWSALFPGVDPPAAPSIASQDITQRCLALTGAFETSTGVPECYCGLSGNFDGQGISFGVLQWNLGQGTLQPMLSEMLATHADVAATIFQNDLQALTGMLASAREQQLAWAQSIQDSSRFTVFEPWNGFFQALGRTPEYQAIQAAHASQIQQRAQTMCGQVGVTTERAMALLFDIFVQNGSLSAATVAAIQADFAQIPAGDPMDVEVARLQSIANRCAEAALPQYVEDVRARKLTIANGQGTVHNIPYNLEQQFGIRLQPFAS